MRLFVSSGVRLWSLSREAKVVYTAFSLSALAGLAVTMLLYEDMVGLGGRGVAVYYAGEEASRPSPRANVPASSSAGPALELPGEAEPAPVRVAMPYRKLLEVTHFHLFTVPVFLLIIAHLFMLTGWSPNLKLGWIMAAWLGAAAHMAAPWAVRYGGAALSGLYVASGGVLLVASLVLTLAPLWYMWRAPSERERGR